MSAGAVAAINTPAAPRAKSLVRIDITSSSSSSRFLLRVTFSSRYFLAP
jgi:hypothetical protein